MPLNTQSVQNDVLNAVVVPQNRQVLDVLLDCVVFVLILITVLVVEFIIVAGDNCIGNARPDVDFIIMPIQDHVVASLGDPQMRVVMVDN